MGAYHDVVKSPLDHKRSRPFGKEGELSHWDGDPYLFLLLGFEVYPGESHQNFQRPFHCLTWRFYVQLDDVCRSHSTRIRYLNLDRHRLPVEVEGDLRFRVFKLAVRQAKTKGEGGLLPNLVQQAVAMPAVIDDLLCPGVELW